ncbi:PIG-L family deacetylase [Akkermansiaceae bacterium]|nr:PIG-L family deacetylase [Akkermansiaceae bacterium]
MEKNKKKYLTVTAHPDDEALGFGASSYALSQKGHKIYNCILSGKVDVRRHRPSDDDLKKHTRNAQEFMGAEAPIIGSFPNIKFNTVAHLDLVQYIERVIEEVQPDIILTHHPYDLNNDHYHTSKACQAAARLFQRKPCKPLTGLYFMEIPSSTDWTFPVDGQNFRPDTFIEVGELGVAQKLKALNAYEGVMRSYPHPRSDESIKALATLRGSQVGRHYCEAFQTAMNISEP